MNELGEENASDTTLIINKAFMVLRFLGWSLSVALLLVAFSIRSQIPSSFHGSRKRDLAEVHL